MEEPRNGDGPPENNAFTAMHKPTLIAESMHNEMSVFDKQVANV